jgi:hypothetical protein
MVIGGAYILWVLTNVGTMTVLTPLMEYPSESTCTVEKSRVVPERVPSVCVAKGFAPVVVSR